MDAINKIANTATSVAIAAIAIQMANKLGAFDGIKKWWKKSTAENDQTII